MPQMRPGIKVKLWSPRFTNRPDVAPPGLLRLLGGISFFSVIGFLVFAVGQDFLNFDVAAEPAEIAYVTMLHFVLPLLLFYLIISNSPLSRWVIVVYTATLCGATATGKGVLGRMAQDALYVEAIAIAISVVILLWLFASPRMRFYYATISGRPIPIDLEERAHELQSGSLLGPRSRVILEWILDHAETTVLLAFIVLVFYAYAST